jgi:hypothetical protein
MAAIFDEAGARFRTSSSLPCRSSRYCALRAGRRYRDLVQSGILGAVHVPLLTICHKSVALSCEVGGVNRPCWLRVSFIGALRGGLTGAGNCRPRWLLPMGGEVLVSAYAAVRRRSRGHTESSGSAWTTDYLRATELGELSGAVLGGSLAGPAPAAGRRGQFCRREPRMTAGRCR